MGRWSVSVVFLFYSVTVVHSKQISFWKDKKRVY